MSEAGTFALFAPAKINLALAVVGRRADGYHLLDSLVAFAGVGDTLTFSSAENFSLTIDGPMAGALTDLTGENIIALAARRLADHAGRPCDAAIRLTKRLPVASGIGGGSTDAAAALRGLVRLWDLHLPEEDLAALALRIGADLPVCLRGRPARMRGIGEIIEDVPELPPAWLTLVNPGMALATPAVFKTRQGPFSPEAPLLTESPGDALALTAALKRGGNDLTAAAVALEPAIGRVLDAIAERPDCLLSRMSGSGATCFGLFATKAGAEAASLGLTAAHPTWWTAAAPLLSTPAGMALPGLFRRQGEVA